MKALLFIHVSLNLMPFLIFKKKFLSFSMMRILFFTRFTLKTASPVQYGWKCGTHVRVFSRTLAHGNARIEIREAEKSEYGKKYNGLTNITYFCNTFTAPYAFEWTFLISVKIEHKCDLSFLKVERSFCETYQSYLQQLLFISAFFCVQPWIILLKCYN